ncbi:MAG TPA: hypothetical protein VK112_13195 [Fodinibius sp.]|nr:hypothetical protein [Fodinibius sp.]
MKKYIPLLLLFTFLFSAGAPETSKAQSIKLVGQNTLNGAINGVLLGGATMALKNSDDFAPLRIGLGVGTLYGIGAGVYDISRINKGQQFYLSGTFNDATNSAIIPLLDTIYGAAGGALIASAVSLIIKEPFVEALQYGSGVGAWVGFGFGLVDGFILADGPNFNQASTLPASNVDGFLSYQNSSKSLEIGFISPDMYLQKELTSHSFSASWKPSVTIMNLSVQL